MSDAQRKHGVFAADPRWYLLQTAVRAERRTAQRLGWDGYTTTLPLVPEPRRDRVKRTRIYTAHVPCFPGYVMVRLDLAHDALHPVLHCEGVKRMFMAAGRPVPFPRGQVEKLMADADARRSLGALSEGSRVRIHAGPFYDHEGVCLWSAADRVALLMEVMGGAREIVVPRASVVRL